MVSLAELRARNVVPVWQESVAVVQELIQTVKATTGSADLLPDLAHVALIPNGDVVALPGSPEPGSPVRHAAVMLKLLLEGVPAPPELEQFVARNVAEPPQFDNVTEFSRNLAFFERPGRRADVERLVGRAIAAEQTTRADEELRRLKDRASEVTQTMAAPDFLQQPQKQVRTVPIPLVAVAGVALIAAGLWIWSRVSQPATPAPVETVAEAAPTPAVDLAATPAADVQAAPAAIGQPATGSAAQPGTTEPAITQPAPSAGPAAPPPVERSLLTRAGDAVRSAVAYVTGSGSSAPAPAAPALAAPAPGTSEGPAAVTAAAPATTAAPSAVARAEAARPRQARSTPAARTATAPPPEVTVAAAREPAAPAPAPAPVAVAPPAPVMPATTDPWLDAPVEVFTASDVSVIPPVIVRPVLPKDPPPDVPPGDIGVVEVVVDENGDVLHVKLISPANRYRERMLVSASKMWKFRPAYKDGRPVRYKTRVRLTI